MVKKSILQLGFVEIMSICFTEFPEVFEAIISRCALFAFQNLNSGRETQLIIMAKPRLNNYLEVGRHLGLI